MKKLALVFGICVLLCVCSCKKNTYCVCTAIVNNESVQLGEDYYVLQEGRSCDDKEKEFEGWGQVTCEEVDVEEEDGDDGGFWSIFGWK